MPSASWAASLPGGPGADRGQMLEWALKYLDAGMAIMDGGGVAWGECSCSKRGRCGNPGKHPFRGWGDAERVTRSREEARYIWSPDRVTGDMICPNLFIVAYLSDLVIADIDDMEAFQTVVDAGQYDFPETLAARSGSGRGMHLLYRREWDRSRPAPSLYSTLPGSCGEIRWTGVIVAPPSSHVSGGAYEWINWGTEIAEAPAWLAAEKIRMPAKMPAEIARNRVEAGRWTTAMRMALEEDIKGLHGLMARARTRAQREGDGRKPRANRVRATYAVSRRAGVLVADGVVPQEWVERKLLDSAVANEWVDDVGEEEVMRQIRNGISDGIRDAS